MARRRIKYRLDQKSYSTRGRVLEAEALYDAFLRDGDIIARDEMRGGWKSHS
jgi:hypothetical protein